MFLRKRHSECTGRFGSRKFNLSVDKILWRKVGSTMLFQRDAPLFIDFHATGRGERPYVMSVSGGVENGGDCPF